MAQRDCPDCSTRMQPFWLPSKEEGDELELDRCNDCGGVWFDAGELAVATRRSVTPGKARTDRQCPECAVPLHRGVLGKSVDVETCVECGGTFLEARDLDGLVQKKAKRATAAPGGTGFVCDECGERKPFSFARPTLTGMACASCVDTSKAPPPEEAKRVSGFGKFLGWLKGE